MDRYWKATEGKDYNHLIIFTGLNENVCGYEFDTGRTYLVYAIQWWHDPNSLYTGLGYRNQLIESAQEDLDFLDEGKAPNKQVSWDEQINQIDIQPLPKPQEATTAVLSMVGIGTAIAGTIAFIALRRSRK